MCACGMEDRSEVQTETAERSVLNLDRLHMFVPWDRLYSTFITDSQCREGYYIDFALTDCSHAAHSRDRRRPATYMHGDIRVSP